MTELRNLHLHGSLADEFGPTHEVYADTFRDAMRIVNCNFPQFSRRVQRGSFHCLHGGPEVEECTDMHDHQLGIRRSPGDFHLMPVAAGAKGRTGKMIFSIVVGGALLFTGVGGGLGLTAIASGAGVGGTVAAIGSSTLALMGAGLVLGGLSMLLTPTPKTSEGSDQKPTSFTFSGPSNVSDEGGPIPLVYGEVITGGITIAASIRDGYGSTSSFDPKGGYTGVTYSGGRGNFDRTLTDLV